MADTSAVPSDVQEIREKARLCVAAEEFEQALAFFTQALALASTAASSNTVSLSLIPTDDLSVSPASLSAALLLERAECYLRMLDFDRALVDVNKARELDADNLSIPRLQCEALFGLKEERQALKIWTAALLKTPLSSDLKLLKRKFPIAAVHVLHAVAMAKAEAANRETTNDDEGRASEAVEELQAQQEFIPETVRCEDAGDKAPSPPEMTGSTTPPPEPERPTDENYAGLMDLDSVEDHTTNWLSRSDRTLSDPGTPQSGSILGASFEPTEISQSMALSSPFVSVNGSDCATSPSSTSSHLDASFVNMNLSLSSFLDEAAAPGSDASIALPIISHAIRAQAPTAETLPNMYDHALAVEASASSTSAQKITAFLRYVAYTPLDDRWIPHALYSTSALYLESHKYSEAAQMRFLAEECEKLHERLGVQPASDGSDSKKREVEHAFTPPWLVLSFDQQRVCVMNGSLHCQLCSSMTPVPLVQYVEHRVKLCPGRKAVL